MLQARFELRLSALAPSLSVRPCLHHTTMFYFKSFVIFIQRRIISGAKIRECCEPYLNSNSQHERLSFVLSHSTDTLKCPILVFCIFQLKESTESNKRSNIRECCEQDVNSNCLHKHLSFPLRHSSNIQKFYF